MDPHAARAQALREFGDIGDASRDLERIGRRRVRHVRRADWLSDLRQDIRHGARSLAHAPLFTVLATVTLALGIGANAAVFSAVKSLLLDSLPYAEPSALVRVYGGLVDDARPRGPLSASTIEEIRARQRSFVRVAGFAGPQEAVYGGDDGARVIRIAWIEPGFFETLGVTATLGRTLRADDGTSGLVPLSGGALGPDTARGVVLTHAAWQRFSGGDGGVVGREFQINGLPRTVVGVLPRDFVGPIGDVDAYLAVELEPVAVHPVAGRRSQWLGMIGRLRPGISQEAGQREVAAVWADLVREHPADNSTLSVAAMPLRDAMVGETRTPLLVLMASAGFVLLIACANLASALLSRSLTRRKELAVRAALGAGRGRLVRQLLTEGLMLAAVGGVAGLLLATLVLSTLRERALPALPDHADLSLDGAALLATALLALGTGLAFSVAPALAVGRSEARAALNDGTRGASESRRSRRLRGAFVAGQIMLCVSLLAGAGLLARSLWTMATAPLGFAPDGVLSAKIRLPAAGYPTPAARVGVLEQFVERVHALPGVDAVALASEGPTAVTNRMGLTLEGTPSQAAQPFVLYASVSDDYFRALGIPLRQGRSFDVTDRAESRPTVVISESMARRYWPAGGALGARIRLGANPSAPFMEVVGIVGDVRNDRARPDAEPMAYRSMRQASPPYASVFVRTPGDPLALVRSVERELRALDAGLPLDRAMTLHALVGEGLAGRRLPVVLIIGFAVLALLLGSVGVYAMFATMVAAREREFGVRMALGSRPRAIAGLVLRQGAGWMAAGLAGGALGVVLVTRLLRESLYGVSPFDPIALGGACVLLLACATVASTGPVVRATRVDPVTALRAQ